MKDYQTFLKTHPHGVMATATNNQPHTRYFQYLGHEGHKAYFCTGSGKRVFEQLTANPHVSFCTCDPKTFETLSIEGTIQFVDDLAYKAKVLEENPPIAEIYKEASNPVFQLFAVDVTLVRSFSFAEGAKELGI